MVKAKIINTPIAPMISEYCIALMMTNKNVNRAISNPHSTKIMERFLKTVEQYNVINVVVAIPEIKYAILYPRYSDSANKRI